MKRVLVVDDAATVRMFHRQILEADGFAVDEAVNGIEALEKALASEFDLYVVDINMPKLNGYAFVERIRAQSDVRQVPIIMVSTEAQSRDRTQALACGANFYIVKPSPASRLSAYVRAMLGMEVA